MENNPIRKFTLQLMDGILSIAVMVQAVVAISYGTYKLIQFLLEVIN